MLAFGGTLPSLIIMIIIGALTVIVRRAVPALPGTWVQVGLPQHSRSLFSTLTKLDAAILLYRHLLKRIHFAFETPDLRSVGSVAADKEGGRPEDHDSNRGQNVVFVCLTVLYARPRSATRPLLNP
jgi:hypothetical protein